MDTICVVYKKITFVLPPSHIGVFSGDNVTLKSLVASFIKPVKLRCYHNVTVNVCARLCDRVNPLTGFTVTAGRQVAKSLGRVLSVMCGERFHKHTPHRHTCLHLDMYQQPDSFRTYFDCR